MEPVLGGNGYRPSANLTRLLPRVWHLEPGSPVRVTLGEAPEGYRVVEQYAVVPSSRSRWLVPVGAHRATVASLWRYAAMKRLPLKVARTGLAALFATGPGYRLFPHRVTVCLDDRVDHADQARWLLLSHLTELLGHDRLVAAIEVRRANANAKPTLQLFDPRGAAVGYARIGWSPGTQQLVRAESAALEAVHARSERLVTPRLMASGQWLDREFSVASPLPEPLRRWDTPPERSSGILADIVSAGEVAEGTLHGSRYERGLRDALLSAGEREPDAAKELLAWLDVLVTNDAGLAFGRWHGDWVPWNHGEHRGSVVAWDWEHSAPHVPAGFDLLHWHFQRTLSASGLDAAVATLLRSTHRLATLGVPAASRPLVAALYLLEMFARVTRMAVGGGGWNPRYHPQMLDVAHEWSASRRDLAR
jgi:hypothetical protein